MSVKSDYRKIEYRNAQFIIVKVASPRFRYACWLVFGQADGRFPGHMHTCHSRIEAYEYMADVLAACINH